MDDGSTDRSANLARRFADVVEHTPVARGPAAARNRGALLARGEDLVFIDADVCVHPDVLRRFVELFAAEPGVGAIFGAYVLNDIVAVAGLLLHALTRCTSQPPPGTAEPIDLAVSRRSGPRTLPRRSGRAHAAIVGHHDLEPLG